MYVNLYIIILLPCMMVCLCLCAVFGELAPPCDAELEKAEPAEKAGREKEKPWYYRGEENQQT